MAKAMTHTKIEAMSEKLHERIYELIALLDDVKAEVECVGAEYNDDIGGMTEPGQAPSEELCSFASEAYQDRSKDFNKIEAHLKKTGLLFSHLQGLNFPEWAK